MGNPYSRPIAILGLAQVGVILIGIAAAGLTCKLWRLALHDDFPPPAITLWVLDWGLLLCLVPLVWAAITGWAQNRETTSRTVGTFLLLLGAGLAVALAVFLLGATLCQYWRLDFMSMGGS